MGALQQIQIAVVVHVAQHQIGPGPVEFRIAGKAAEIRHQFGVADVDEMPAVELSFVRLEQQQRRVRNAFEGVGRVVGAHGDVEEAILVDVADAWLAVIGHGIAHVQFGGSVLEAEEGALADEQVALSPAEGSGGQRQVERTLGSLEIEKTDEAEDDQVTGDNETHQFRRYKDENSSDKCQQGCKLQVNVHYDTPVLR